MVNGNIQQVNNMSNMIDPKNLEDGSEVVVEFLDGDVEVVEVVHNDPSNESLLVRYEDSEQSLVEYGQIHLIQEV